MSLVQLNVELHGLNTLGLHSIVDAFAEFNNEQQLFELIAWAKSQKQKLQVLGGGSNLLLSEKITGLLIKSNQQLIEPMAEKGAGQNGEHSSEYNYWRVSAGVNWHSWVQYAIQQNAYGLENLALIPGTVGASPVQNIGAYGTEVSDLIESVQGVRVSRPELGVLELSADQCDFSYRDSIFKKSLKDDFIITSVVFKLSKRLAANLTYGPLQQISDKLIALENDQQKAQMIFDHICHVRSQKLPDPQQIPNVGSFFKNPVVSAQQAQRLQDQFPDLPCYSQAQGRVKLAAGWLIEQAGWKGKGIGAEKSAVRMYEKQALVMIAEKSSRAARLSDVLQLQQAIEQSVLEQFSVTLEREPQSLA